MNDTWHNVSGHNAQCRYAECHIFMLSVVMLSVITLSVFMPSVVMLNVVMLSVMAPSNQLTCCKNFYGYADVCESVFPASGQNKLERLPVRISRYLRVML
jgi:hypothetical protein